MFDTSSNSAIDAPSADLEVILLPQADTVVVVLHGEHDLATKDQLRETLTEALDTHRLVVVDVSVAQFVDSSTLGELIRADKRATEEGKQFRLQFGTAPIVRRAFEVTGLLSVFEWYPTRAETLDGRRRMTKQPDRPL